MYKISDHFPSSEGFSADDCKKETVGPVVAEIKAIFVAAIEQVKVLVGASVNVVLASDCNGTVISVSEFATLFGTLINVSNPPVLAQRK